MELTHFNDQGRARMVDVTDKEKTFREAEAEGRVRMAAATLEKVRAGPWPRGTCCRWPRWRGSWPPSAPTS